MSTELRMNYPAAELVARCQKEFLYNPDAKHGGVLLIKTIRISLKWTPDQTQLSFG
jgi:hypothetical protein